jgi:hypothetical protein
MLNVGYTCILNTGLYTDEKRSNIGTAAGLRVKHETWQFLRADYKFSL